MNSTCNLITERRNEMEKRNTQQFSDADGDSSPIPDA